MTTPPPGNRLLNELDAEDRRLVLTASIPTDFGQGHVFHEAGEPIQHVHFVECGIVSTVAALKDGRTVETAMIGREGLVGGAGALAPHRAHGRSMAQVGGSARRMDAARLRALMAERPGVREVIGRFLVRLQDQLEQAAACNALHRAEQRFARWLLRCHERVEGDTFHLTQDHLAAMLGSQRTTVNEAAQQLQRAGAIGYSRGRVTIVNRGALERAACECHAGAERTGTP